MRTRHRFADMKPSEGQLVYYSNGTTSYGVARFINGRLFSTTTLYAVEDEPTLVWWATAFDVTSAATARDPSESSEGSG